MPHETLSEQPTVPCGTCHCGCGNATTVIHRKDRTTGEIIHVPRRFVHGHNRRKAVRYIEVSMDYPTPCHVWQLATTAGGYGKSHDNSTGKSVLAHRLSYEDKYGPIPVDLQLDHLCSTRSCVRPSHLEPVTASENVRRGRATKLTAEDIRWIRRSNEKQIVLARRYGVGQGHISRIKNDHTWRGIEPVGLSGGDAPGRSPEV
jgi:HNH endonuclease